MIDFARSLKVDLILRKDRPFSVAEFERRETHEVEGMRLTLASPEDVLLAKLERAKIGDSERQIEDAAGILRMQGDALDLQYVEGWVETLEIQPQWLGVRQRVG